MNLHDENIENNVYTITIVGVNGEKADLKLNEEQHSLVISRLRRSFYKRCRKEKIDDEIERAVNFAELENISQKYYLCDVCDLSEINIYAARRLLKVVVNVLYLYPKLRSKFCYIGTHSGYERLLLKLRDGDADVLNRFNLHYICSAENAESLGTITLGTLSVLSASEDDFLAVAVSAFGFLDAVLFDRDDYDGYAYLQCLSALRRDVANGFHPQGCQVAESVVYHEVGHMIDGMCGFSQSAEFNNFHDALTEEEIAGGLCEYALASPQEFVAEAFAEYMCNPSPRTLAQTTARMLSECYEKLPD